MKSVDPSDSCCTMHQDADLTAIPNRDVDTTNDETSSSCSPMDEEDDFDYDDDDSNKVLHIEASFEHDDDDDEGDDDDPELSSRRSLLVTASSSVSPSRAATTAASNGNIHRAHTRVNECTMHAGSTGNHRRQSDSSRHNNHSGIITNTFQYLCFIIRHSRWTATSPWGLRLGFILAVAAVAAPTAYRHWVTTTTPSNHHTQPMIRPWFNNHSNVDDNYAYPEHIPDVVWLMSMVGTGSSDMILAITEQLSNRTTGTNYGTQLQTLLPIHPPLNNVTTVSMNQFSQSSNSTSWSSGPYIASPTLPLPNRFILTKTHCGTMCVDHCLPVGRPSDRTDVLDFSMLCGSGKRLYRGIERSVSYDSTRIPQKAVHVIRNPFDSIIHRMYKTLQHHPPSQSTTKNRTSTFYNYNPKLYNASRRGIRQWCDYLDQTIQTMGGNSIAMDSPLLLYAYNSPTLLYTSHVPCAIEWYRYITWHNLAVSLTTNKLALPVHYVWMENYTTAFDTTVQHLFDFLELDQITDPLSSHGNVEQHTVFRNNGMAQLGAVPTYVQHFDADMKCKVARMLRDLASNATWDLIRHYVEPYVPSNNHCDDGRVDDDNDETATAGREVDLHLFDDDNDTITDELFRRYETSFATQPQEPNDPQPDTVWLISFPNSGTSYTLMNVEQITNVTTGTNYAKDWTTAVPVRPEYSSGPFLHKLDQRVGRAVLTKTHCYGYCDDCAPKHYVPVNNTVFERGCRRAEMPNRGGDAYYDASIPIKAVHLFRSPFDNIVARMHLAVKKRQKVGNPLDDLSAYTNSKEGLAAWCQYLDAKYAQEEEAFFSDDVKTYFKDLPCHADWYRYVLWHNHAFEMTERLGIPVHYLYYEDYTERFESTVHDLLDFLHLEPRQPPIDFYVGKSYESFYELDDARKAASLVKALGSPATWNHTKHYFAPFLKE